MKSLAILQSNYIPWKGYLDIVASVDEFLIFDEVQYTRNDWRNRNKIIVRGEPRWITIPVRKKGFGRPINDIEADGNRWADTHWKTVSQAYSKAAFFAIYEAVLESLYREAALLTRLTEINELFLRKIVELMEIPTLIGRADEVVRRAQTPTDRLLEICLSRGATQYVSGPAAQAYIEAEKFARAGIELRYANYSGYPAYEQNTRIFDHGVSILDTLMRCGTVARTHLKALTNRDDFLAPA